MICCKYDSWGVIVRFYVQVVFKLHHPHLTHFSLYIAFIWFTDLKLRTFFMGNKNVSKVGNFKMLFSKVPCVMSSYHKTTSTHTKSQNSKYTSILHKHNPYRIFLYIQQCSRHNRFSGMYLFCNSRTTCRRLVWWIEFFVILIL